MIPTAIKLTVALRQINPTGDLAAIDQHVDECRRQRRLGKRLAQVKESLAAKFGCAVADLRLDHTLALENRTKVFKNGIHVEYEPRASDPSWLMYRPHGAEFIESHLIKTNVRGDGAQHSDRAMAAKNKNIARNRDLKRRKAKLRSRGFQKGLKRKWPKRKFGR